MDKRVNMESAEQKLSELVAKATGAAMAKAQGGSPRQAIGLSAAIAGLKGLAYACMNDPAHSDPTDDHMLFAALYASACVTCNGEIHAVEIAPTTALHAMDDYEKLKGRRPDHLLDPEFVQWARCGIDISDDQKVSLARFLPH